MYPSYRSVFYPLYADWEKEGGMRCDAPQGRSLPELYELEAQLLQDLSELRTQEPAKKRNKKLYYEVWVERNADLYDKIKEVRDEIERKKNEGREQ